MKHVIAIVIVGLLGACGSVLASDHGLMIQDPWIREAPPNAKMLAGYLVIMNHGAKDMTLIGASSAEFGDVEIHRTEIHGNMAKMIAQKDVSIAKHKTVQFKPGGLHLMLMYPKRPLKAGDKVILELSFSSGDRVEVNAVVKKGGKASAQHHHEHMHDH